MTSATLEPGDGRETLLGADVDQVDTACPIEEAGDKDEAPTRPWTERLVQGPARVAFTLNEHFVGLARHADKLMRRAERAVTQKLSRRGEEVEEEENQAAREEQLVRWARVRLSELHLRVGQSLYQLEDKPEQSETENEAIRRQLLALLAEIDRLEGILSRAGNKPTSGPLSNDGVGAECLFSQLEVELGDETEGI